MLSIHRHVLKDAWNTVVNTWYLWPLGLFASLLGNGSDYQLLYDQIQIINNQQFLIIKLNELLLTPMIQLSQAMSNWNAIHFIIALIFILLIGLLVWATISSVTGLIYGTAKKIKGEDSSIKELIAVGNKNFFSTLGYVVISKVVIGFIIAVIFTPLLVATYQAGYSYSNTIVGYLLVVLVIPIMIVINFITKFAIASSVLEGFDFKNSWLHAWRLFKDNWLIVIEQAVILLMVNLVVGLVLIIGFFIVFGPFFLLGSVTYGGFFPLVVLGILLTGVLIVFLGSLLGFFQYAAWTSLYLHLNENPSYLPKIVRFISGLPTYFNEKVKNINEKNNS